MQASVTTFQSLRFSSDVWVNNEFKASFSVASFLNSAAQFCKACVQCSNSGKLSVVLSKYRTNCPVYVWWAFTVKKLAKISTVLLTLLDEIPDVFSSCFKMTLKSLDCRSRNQGESNRAFPLPEIFKKIFNCWVQHQATIILPSTKISAWCGSSC